MPDRFQSAHAGRRVAVTGAGGYVGGALTAALLAGGARVLRVSRRELAPLAGAEDMVADIRAPEPWNRLAAEAEVIFHLAGETSVYAADRDPAASLSANVMPLAHLLAAARRGGTLPTVILAGTATQVGMPASLPVDETLPDRPVTLYDRHKLMAEAHLFQGCDDRVLRGACLRLANVYGPGPNPNGAADRGILNKVVKTALAGGTVTIFGDGGQLRDYVFIDDVVAAFLAAAARPQAVNGRPFIVASGEGVTFGEAFRLAVRLAEAATGRAVTVEEHPWPPGMSPIEFRNFVARTDALRTVSGWAARVSLEQGLKRAVASFAEVP